MSSTRKKSSSSSAKDKKESGEGTVEVESQSQGDFTETFPSLLQAIKVCIKETDVKCIDVGNLGLESAHIKAISDILPGTQVTEFRADNTNLMRELPKMVKGLTKSNLEKLSFRACKFQVKDLLTLMEALQNTKVKDLDLSCLSLSDSYPPTSAKMFFVHLIQSHLTHLRLCASPLLGHSSGKDLAFHLPHTSITHLWLEHTNLNRCEDALKNLFTNLPKTALVELYLGHNEIEDDQLKLLAKFLKKSKLEVLDLTANKITDVGVDLLSKSLEGSKLCQLILSENNISGANNLGKHLKKSKVTTLHLGQNKIVNCEMFSFPDFLKGTAVTELNFNHCSLGDEVAQMLFNCLESSKVTKIILSGNNLGLPAASKFSSVVAKTNITEVDFSENDFSDEALQALAKGLKGSKLKKLTLQGGTNQQKGSSVVEFVGNLKDTALECLVICHTDLKSYCGILAESLKNTTLTHLDLSCCQIGTGLADLAPVLKETEVTHLNLSSNEIDDIGAEKLAEFLAETKILQLNLGGNRITDQGAEALGNCLKAGPLYLLNLSCNKITDTGLEKLAEMMEFTFVTDLDVTCNDGGKLLPLTAVLWRNKLLVHKLVSFFRTIAPADGDKFRFDATNDRKALIKFAEKCMLFYKDIAEEPSSLSALASDESLGFSRTKLTEIMKEFPSQFLAFIVEKTKLKVNWPQLVRAYERAEALGVKDIVKSFLLHFASFMVEVRDGILAPEVYRLLEKHKEAIASVVPKPEDKELVLHKFRESERPVCGLCGDGNNDNLTRTQCCDRWICMQVYPYTKSSCDRKHDRYSWCSTHHANGHSGPWKGCQDCIEEFDADEEDPNMCYDFE